MASQLLQSLKILAGGPSTQRVLPTESYGFAGQTPTQGELSSPFEQEQTARAAAADARDRAATEHIQATNAAVQEHNRPDVKAIQDEQEADALKRLLLPIQMRGQYAVEAAKQSQLGQMQRAEFGAGQRSGLRSQQDEALAERAGVNNKAIMMRQRLAALQGGKAHAAPPSGISGWVPGAQGRADQAEIANLLAQMESGGGAATGGNEAAPIAGAAPSRMSRPLKSGGVAYSDDGGATWYQE